MLNQSKIILYIDECSFCCNLRKNYGRSSSKERIMTQEYNNKDSLSVIASIDFKGNLYYMIFDGSLKEKDFTGFICKLY